MQERDRLIESSLHVTCIPVFFMKIKMDERIRWGLISLCSSASLYLIYDFWKEKKRSGTSDVVYDDLPSSSIHMSLSDEKANKVPPQWTTSIKDSTQSDPKSDSSYTRDNKYMRHMMDGHTYGSGPGSS